MNSTRSRKPEIDDHEELEAIANALRSCRGEIISMAPRPASTTTSYSCVGCRAIPSPKSTPHGSRRRNPVGLVFEARKKAADPSDRDAEHERQGEEVAGRDAYAPQTLDRLDGDQSADQAADDRLSAEEELRLHPVVRREDGILEGRQEAASGESTDDRRSNHPPARTGIDHISALPAEASIEVKARGVGKALEYPVRMDDQRPQTELRRKLMAPRRKR